MSNSNEVPCSRIPNDPLQLEHRNERQSFGDSQIRRGKDFIDVLRIGPDVIQQPTLCLGHWKRLLDRGLFLLNSDFQIYKEIVGTRDQSRPIPKQPVTSGALFGKHATWDNINVATLIGGEIDRN